MGMLLYGAARLAIAVDDVTLAHLKLIITSKLRRSESFLISWRDSSDVGDGRSSVWIHADCDLHYKFDGSRPPKVDPERLEAMAVESYGSQGIRVHDVTLVRPEDARGRR